MSSAIGKGIYLNWRSAGILLSPAEFDAIERYDRRFRYELIRGVVVVSPIPSVMEACANQYLGYLLHRYEESREQGKTLDATLPDRYVNVENGRRLSARVIWSGLGRLPKPSTDVPTIAVDFVPRGKRDFLRDYVTKRDEYLAAGVKEYWTIDQFRRTMTVWQPSKDELVVPEQGSYSTPRLPGFVMPLARVLAESDQWEKK